MKYRKFGRTDWQVSEIAFGTWQIGGDWGAVDDAASIKTLLHAYERGINLVDTAELYGHGHSEEVIGKSLRQWSGDKIYVATKAQPVVWPEKTDDNPMMKGRYPDWYLRQQVEGSLKRLQVERLDLFQLHCWVPRGTTELDWLETLNDLRQEGKIDQIGVSIRDYRADEGINLARLGLVAAQQVVFNLFEQTPARGLFPAGIATEQAFIARVPFDSGSLTGTWTEDTY
ncbi:MAG: aldo/keto reductase [Thiolinea sp.]